MRVLLDKEHVVEVKSIIGNTEEYGKYTVAFDFVDDIEGEGIQFEYNDSIDLKKAQERCKYIIKEALEKGYVDCSEEPWDIKE